MLVIESMHRFHVGRNMCAVCVVDHRPEHGTVVLRHAFCRIGMPGTSLPSALDMGDALRVAV